MIYYRDVIPGIGPICLRYYLYIPLFNNVHLQPLVKFYLCSPKLILCLRVRCICEWLHYYQIGLYEEKLTIIISFNKDLSILYCYLLSTETSLGHFYSVYENDKCGNVLYIVEMKLLNDCHRMGRCRTPCITRKPYWSLLSLPHDSLS